MKPLFTAEDVLQRINHLISSIIDCLDQDKDPILSLNNDGGNGGKSMDNLSQCRGYTNMLLILSFVQKLLLSQRSTTNRELYYFFVTHFRSQREVDSAIIEVCNLLGVERIALGLSASPKGWFCGNISISRPTPNRIGPIDQQNESTIDGTALSSIQGLPITREWIYRAAQQQQCYQKEKDLGINYKINNPHSDHLSSHKNAGNFKINSNARCILVIEKEGVYTRLSEDRFYERYPCILVTGKGFPDIATRALVYILHQEFKIPVYGVCDCNPFGVSVLQTYRRGGEKRKMDGRDRYMVPIQWAGLRPSQLATMKSDLPSEIYQSLTDIDKRKIEKLSQETGNWMDTIGGCQRQEELHTMLRSGHKVELESLHWLGMDFMSEWLENILEDNQHHG